MPDGHAGSSNVSLTVSNDLLDAFDKLAEALGRPRSWVMVRALRCYLSEEGAQVFEDSESLAELDRGEVVASEDLHQRLREIIDEAEELRARKK